MECSLLPRPFTRIRPHAHCTAVFPQGCGIPAGTSGFAPMAKALRSGPTRPRSFGDSGLQARSRRSRLCSSAYAWPCASGCRRVWRRRRGSSAPCSASRTRRAPRPWVARCCAWACRSAFPEQATRRLTRGAPRARPAANFPRRLRRFVANGVSRDGLRGRLLGLASTLGRLSGFRHVCTTAVVSARVGDCVEKAW